MITSVDLVEVPLNEAELIKYQEASSGVLTLGDGEVRDYRATIKQTRHIYCQQVVNSLALLRFEDGSTVSEWADPEGAAVGALSSKEQALLQLGLGVGAVVYSRYRIPSAPQGVRVIHRAASATPAHTLVLFDIPSARTYTTLLDNAKPTRLVLLLATIDRFWTVDQARARALGIAHRALAATCLGVDVPAWTATGRWPRSTPSSERIRCEAAARAIATFEFKRVRRAA